MDIEEIKSTITELENGPATFDSCIKLSSLYNVLEHLIANEDVVVDEYRDILPSYSEYKEIKRQYQMHNTTGERVLYSMKSVCSEINEFLHILYISTDTQEERNLLQSMLKEIVSQF